MPTCHCCLLSSRVKICESPNLATAHGVAIWCNRVQHRRALDRYCTASVFRHETNYISKEHRSIWSTSLRAQTTSFFNGNRYFKSSRPVHRTSFHISLNRTCYVTSQEFTLRFLKSVSSSLRNIRVYLPIDIPSGVPRNFFRGGGVQKIQLRTEDRQNGDLGSVDP